MEEAPKRTPRIKDLLMALMHDLLDAAEDEGYDGWTLIRQAEMKVQAARSHTYRARAPRKLKAG